MTQLATTGGSAVQEESDFDLLTTIGCADIDRGQAERALEALYNRHGKLLKGMAESADWARYGADSDVLVQLTFLKVWEKAGTFDPRNRRAATSEDAAVKLWLLAILKHTLLDEIRRLGRRIDAKLIDPSTLDSERRDLQEDYGDGDIAFAVDGVETGIPAAPDAQQGIEADRIRNPDVEIVQKWLALQTSGDRDMLLASIEYIDFRTGRCVIPPDHLNGLADMLGVLPETIKVKRGRLLDRLKKFVIENR